MRTMTCARSRKLCCVRGAVQGSGWMDGWKHDGAAWGHSMELCGVTAGVTVLSVLLLRGEELSHGMSTALRGFAGTVRHENAFPSVASGPNKLGKYKTLWLNLYTTGWGHMVTEGGYRYMCLCDLCSCKSLITFRDSFLAVSASSFTKRPCKDVQGSDGYVGKCSTSKDNFCELIVQNSGALTVPSSVLGRL